jgi:hypothetical protein
MKPTQLALLESPESASPIVSKSVAAGLQGKYHESLGLSQWQRSALRLLGSLPPGLARSVLSHAQTFTALDYDILNDLSSESLAQARVNDYASLVGKFPSIIIGAALGGAAAHLALALGGPFLPQAFVLTLKGGSVDGDPFSYFNRSAGVAATVAGRNPDIVTIQHYDPVHDGWITKRANHLRIKLIALPHAYDEFIRRRLQPGGTVYYLECGATWLRYRTGERGFFQVGGWGGLAPQEFLEGSPRIQRFCQASGLRSCNWQLPGFALETGPESEWGSEAGLGEALEDFCRLHGFRYLPIQLAGPFDYARLAFSTHSLLLEEEGTAPSGVLVEMFSQFDALAARQGGLLPLWLVFNTDDSLAFFKEMRPEIPRDRPVFFSAVPTFSLTPDLVPWSGWEEAFDGLDWRNLGPRPDYYPSDTRTLLEWNKPLRRWVNKYGKPIKSHINPEQLQVLAARIRGKHSML